MGYRSDVAYIVKFHHNSQPEKVFADYIAFQDWVKNKHTTIYTVTDLATQKEVERLHTYEDEANHIKWSGKESLMMFQVDDVKWYESFGDVRWHTELLEKVKEYETGNYRFVRIGEDYNDVEVDEHAETYFEIWELLDIQRCVTVNVPDDEFDKEKDDE